MWPSVAQAYNHAVPPLHGGSPQGRKPHAWIATINLLVKNQGVRRGGPSFSEGVSASPGEGVKIRP